MKLKQYRKSKPSGVEWLGEVPKHWEVKRLKYSVSINDETLAETTLPECEIEYVDIGSVTGTEGITTTELLLFEGAPSRARRRARDGDSIVSTVRTYLRAIAPVINPPDNLIVSTGFAVVRPRKIQPGFLAYALRESAFVESVVSRSTGVSYPAVNASEVGRIPIPIPSSTEQTAIAAYLDRETGRIDELVGKKRDLIERLKEKRTALISRTVTRGLPADLPPETLARLEEIAGETLTLNPPLKSSGIDWLGDVPVHWDVSPLFRITTSIQTGPFGSQLHAADYVEGGIPLINPAHIVGGRLVPDDLSAVDESTAKRLSRHRLDQNDIVMARRGEIGRCAVVGENESGWLCGTGSLVIRLRQSCAKYYWNVISGAGFSALLELNAVGTTMLNLNPTIVGRMLVPVPPHPEQRAIAAYLDEETAKLDALVAKVETAIERLHEYRTALITAAVTGKIDVRKEAES